MLHQFASCIAAPDVAVLLGLALRSSVVLLFAGLILRLLGRRASSAIRATMLVTALCALLVLPIFSRFAPRWPIALLPAFTQEATETTARVPKTALVSTPSAASSEPSAAVQTAEQTSSTLNAPAAVAPYRVSIAFCLWTVGVIGYGIWLLVGRLRLLALAAQCPIVANGPLGERVKALATVIGVRRPVVVRQASADPSGVITPMTWGWLRPTLLLPTEVLEGWPEERTRAVLLHELAHIARQDWITQVVLQLVCALYWFNPLVWRTATLWEREAEQACDDRVLLAGIAASDYAAHLLEVVRSLRALHPVVSQGSAHAMAAPRSNVQIRLIAILEKRRNRRRTSLRTGISAMALGGLLLVPIAAVRLTSQAQADPLTKVDQVDVEDLITKAMERSWRGEYAEAAKLARQALQQKDLDDDYRGSATMVLFEAAWWQGDRETENKNYSLFKAIAAKHPENQTLQGNLATADRYRSRFDPHKATAQNLIEAIEYLIKAEAYADGLHYAKYLLGRADVPQGIRVRALLAAYQGAHYWSFADSVAGLEKQFHSEATALPEAVRQSLEAQLQTAKTAKTAEQKTAEGGPVNLGFALGLEGWANDNPQHDAEKLYTLGMDLHGGRQGQPVPLLASKGGDPKHYGTLMQNFSQPGLKGKRIRYSAYMKTKDVTQGAGLWIVLFGANRDNHAWNMTTKPIKGTMDWQKVEWAFDVPENNTGFSFGIDLTGNGKVWVEDFRFEVVDKTVPVSPEAN